jgi:hypothetical protein
MHRPPRRSVLKGVALGIASVVLTRNARDSRAANELGVELPPDVGQSPLQVYVPETGHTVRGMMLDYWRAGGAAHLYGHPVSEPFAGPNGRYTQAFERAVLEYRPEYLWSEQPVIRPMRLFNRTSGSNSRTTRHGRRIGGGGHGRGSAWLPLQADSKRVSRALTEGGLYFESTGHTLKGTMLEWYRAHEGEFYLGAPVSEAFTERGNWTQYFDNGRLVQLDDGVRLGSLDPAMLRDLGIDRWQVEQGDLPVFDELLFWEAANPNPLADPYAPGRKLIEISIGEQRLWAYHGGTAITSSLVSTGLSPNDTNQGWFRLRLKYREQDMRGFTDESGEVLGFGEAPPGTIPYGVEDVPHVMYFNLDAEALHGAYWHNNFGTPMSHGCVNLPLDIAAFLFGWAPLGTPVWVHG